MGRRYIKPGAGQLPMFTPKSVWRPPTWEELPQSWKDARRVGIDIESCDPGLKKKGLGPAVRRDGFMAGFSFAIEDGPKHYLPFAHEGGDNLDKTACLTYLQDRLKEFEGELVGANLQYDLDYLLHNGITFPKVKRFRDVLIAEPLIDELQYRYNLNAVLERHGLPPKDEALLREAARDYHLDPKEDIWRLPARYVGPYGEQDAFAPLGLLRRQERVIDDQDLWEVYNLESDVMPVLLRMKRRGVRIDFKQLAKVEKYTLTEEEKALRIVKDKTGIDIGVGNVWNANIIAPALEYIGVKLGKTKEGQPNITKDILESIDHKVASSIAWARNVNKVRTTFAASIRRYEVKGRIHPHFNQLKNEDRHGVKGAAYGRLSSEDPNIQQQPSRDKILAPMWRKIYIPEDGCLWFADDYSQQEPRLTTHFAYISGCKGAGKAVKKYNDDPNTDNHAFMAELTGLDRKYAKNIFLGLCYGMGGAKLSRSLGLPTKMIKNHVGFMIEVAGDEAQAILDQFNAHAPYIKTLSKKAERRALQRGYIKTLSGRRCRFPKDDKGRFDWAYKALNRLIQGSAGDQTKRALVEVDKAGYFLQLQVHDEIDGSVEKKKHAEEIGEIMCNVYSLSVPSKVDVEVGPSWGEAA
ncbi:MAG: DNA polymerase [Acidimicrobiia bacterium]|nr:DNA polymerase [Acidimicrobiia bacterium]